MFNNIKKLIILCGVFSMSAFADGFTLLVNVYPGCEQRLELPFPLLTTLTPDHPFVKQYTLKDAPDVEVVVSFRKREIECTQIDVTVKSDVETFRQVSIQLETPWGETGKKVWLPTASGEPMIIDQKQWIYEYRSEKGVNIPVVSTYDHQVGHTIALPLDIPVPAAHIFGGSGKIGIMVESLACTKKRPAHTAFLLIDHKPHWRPGFGWYVNEYKEFFVPQGDAILVEKCDGPVMLGVPDYKELDYFKKLGIKWVHLSVALSHQYYNEFISSEMTPEKIHELKKMLTKLKDSNIQPFAYWQPLEYPFNESEKNFASGQFKQSSGNFSAEGWQGSYGWQVPDRSIDWGMHTLEQARRLTNIFPELSGIYVDVNCHSGFDYALWDGISARTNGRNLWGERDEKIDNLKMPVQKVYQYAFALRDAITTVSDITHARKMNLAVGQGADLGACRGSDVLLIENTEKFASSRFQGAMKTISFIDYFMDIKDVDKRLDNLERIMKKCLLYGGFFGTNTWEYSKIDSPMFRGYWKLYKHLESKQFVFDSNPISVVAKDKRSISFDIFNTTNDHCYTVVIISNNTSWNNGNPPETDLDVTLRIPGIDIESATGYSAHFSMPVKVKLEKTKKETIFHLPRHGTASVLKVKFKKTPF